MIRKNSTCYRSGDCSSIFLYGAYKESKIIYNKAWVKRIIQYIGDLCRSLKAKIMANFIIFMPYSIQVYQFLTTKTTPQIFSLCDGARRNHAERDNPRFLKVESHATHVTGTIRLEKRVSLGNDIFHYNFTIKPKDDLLIIQGSSVGRNDVNEFLATVIEDDSRYNVIRQRTLSNDQMLRIFSNIVKQYPRNIILKLKCLFDPESGFEYARETYTELEYRFVENRCASKHRDFNKIMNNAKSTELTLGILKCVGIEKELNTHHVKLVVKPDCSFRMFKDVEAEDWHSFVTKIVDFV